MSNFETALTVVLQHEGGYIDDPLDAGGPTNCGITLAVLREYCRNPDLTIFELKSLSPEKIADVYRVAYWTPMGFDGIDSLAVTTLVFDQAVLHGKKWAAEKTQTILGITADGGWGPNTTAALNAANPQTFILKFARATQRFNNQVVVANPTQIRFLAGWTDRLFDLLDLTLGRSPVKV